MEPCKLKEALFKDLEVFQRFYLYGHWYTKLSGGKARSETTNDVAYCDPNNCVQIAN